MNKPSPARIFNALRAYQDTAALKAGIDLAIFTHIADGAATAGEIAERCEASERGVRILCDTLVIGGFLEKADLSYTNTPDAALFLNRKSPAYLGTAAEFLCVPDILDGAIRGLAAAVRKGGTLLEGQGSVNPDNPIWVTFAHAMAPMMQLPARAMAAHLPTTGPLKVLDIAAGHGVFGIATAQHNPEARIVALDWAAVLEVAKANAAKAGISDRYNTIAGDFFTQDLGSDYDAILITNFLHHFDVPTCEQILRKVYAALKPGGSAITLEFVPNEDRVSPPTSGNFAMTMLISTPAGDAYTWGDYEPLFHAAGFTQNRIEMLETQQSVIISTK